jgi:acetylornithine deacetylase/succinyl-diaminopimelate desuccinylase-like protein
MYGGAALNAAHALIETLNALIAHDGTLVEPLRQGIAAPTEEELAGWRLLPAGASELAEQGAKPKDPRSAEDFYVRTFAEPALDVNGIASGSPVLQKTVLPVEAIANLSIRLAPGQQPAVIGPEVVRLLQEAAPEGTELDIEMLSSAEPGLVPPDAKAIQLGLDAFEQALGVRPALIRSGGTLPIVPALANKGIPTVITGFGLPDSQIHSPNERLVAEYVPKGIEAAPRCSSPSRRCDRSPLARLTRHRRRRSGPRRRARDLPRGRRGWIEVLAATPQSARATTRRL